MFQEYFKYLKNHNSRKVFVAAHNISMYQNIFENQKLNLNNIFVGMEIKD